MRKLIIVLIISMLSSCGIISPNKQSSPSKGKTYVCEKGHTHYVKRHVPSLFH